MTRSFKIDVCVTAAFLIVGGIIGRQFLLSHPPVFFYQHFMPAIVPWACGHGLGLPATPIPELAAFLNRQAPAFDCALLNGIAVAGEPGSFFYSQFYLAAAAAACWRILGVSYGALWPLAAAMYAVYGASCFILLRLYSPRPVAILAGMIAISSPLAIAMLASLRDFSKAPFILFGLVVLICAVRASRPRHLAILAGVAGAIVGVGNGFRADVNMILLAGTAVFLFGVSASARARIACLSLFLVVAGLFLLPSMKGTRGGAGYFALQGMTSPFRNGLAIAPTPYNVGTAYEDLINLSTIVADLRRTNTAEWDRHEAQVTDLHESWAFTRATSYFLTWAPFFIGDIATRAVSSLAWTSAFYTVVSTKREAIEVFKGIPLQYPVTSSSALIFVIGAGWLGLVALLFKMGIRSIREAGTIGGTVLFLCAVQGLQFSTRHLFYLEVVYLLGLVSLVSLRARDLRFVPPFLTVLTASAVVLFVFYVSALRLQDHFLKKAINEILAAPAVPVQIRREALSSSRTAILFPPTDLPSVTSPPPTMMIKAAAERVVMEVGSNCTVPKIDITLGYANRSNFDQVIAVDRPAGSDKTLVIFSAFITPVEHFNGIVVPNDAVPCIEKINRVQHVGRLPSSFTAVLAPGWKDRGMFELPSTPFALMSK